MVARTSVTAAPVTGRPSRKLPIKASAACVSASSRGSPRKPQVPLMVWTRRKILPRILALFGSCSKRTSSTSTTSRLSLVSVRNSRSKSSMDDLLREFLTETSESLDVVDVELVRFEQDPNNAKILGNIFRLVHTIKGTCGFLGLPRLEALTHAAEALMGNFRDGLPVTGAAVTLVLATIDRVKALLEGLERDQAEPEGNDRDLIG